MGWFKNITFEEKDGDIIVRGTFENSTDKALTCAYGTGRFRDSETDILLFPGLNIMTNRKTDVISPFQQVEFCHLLSEGEANEARRCNFKGFSIGFVDSDNETLYESPEKPVKNSGENVLIERYNHLPEWLRWILFLPISVVFSLIIWFLVSSFANREGAFPFVIAVLHPAVVQGAFLFSVFCTIPKAKLKCVLVLIILRSLVLLIFVASPVLVLLGAEQSFDLTFFKELAGEILTLIGSVWVYRTLREAGVLTDSG